MEYAVVKRPIDDAQRKRRMEAVIKRLIRLKGPNKGYSRQEITRLYWEMYPTSFTYYHKPITAQSLTGAEAGETKDLTSLQVCHCRRGRRPPGMGKVKHYHGHRRLRSLNFGGTKTEEPKSSVTPFCEGPNDPGMTVEEPDIGTSTLCKLPSSTGTSVHD